MSDYGLLPPAGKLIEDAERKREEKLDLEALNEGRRST